MLLLIIKAIKFLRKYGPDSVKRVNLYTSAIGTVCRLCNTSIKPTGKGLSIAFTAALEDLIDQFPHVEVSVISFHKSQLLTPCHHMHWEQCIKCNYLSLLEIMSRTRFFGGKILFPNFYPHDLKQRRVTNDLISRWQEDFEDEDRVCYKGHSWLKLWNLKKGKEKKKLIPSHINFRPWLCSHNGLMITNDPCLCR
jgi:hypothetical protein